MEHKLTSLYCHLRRYNSGLLTWINSSRLFNRNYIKCLIMPNDDVDDVFFFHFISNMKWFNCAAENVNEWQSRENIFSYFSTTSVFTIEIAHRSDSRFHTFNYFAIKLCTWDAALNWIWFASMQWCWWFQSSPCFHHLIGFANLNRIQRGKGKNSSPAA